VIFETPTVYEFGSPVRGTFPPWRDPYYWFAGITPHFDLAGQWRVLKANLKILKEQAWGLQRGFIYGFLILLFMNSDWRVIQRTMAKQWFLLFSALAALAMFSVVLVQDRYIAPYPMIIGLVLFSAVAVVRSADSRKLVNVVVLLAAVLFGASSARPAAGELVFFSRSLRGNEILGRGGPWHQSSQAVSDALKTHGVLKGDKVSYIGEFGDFYWARLAGVQVNAEIRQSAPNSAPGQLVPAGSVAALESSVDIYWASAPERKERIDLILYKAGSKAIVTDAFPVGGDRPGWDRVPGTSYYIHMLPDGLRHDRR
jgi:hypothetical protein